MTPKLACFLRDYKVEQESRYIISGKILNLDDLVFSNSEFKPICPTKVSEAFRGLCARAGLKGIRFHDLRHIFASLMLMRGVSPKVISEALGHSSVAFTLTVYSHIIESMQQDAMALLDDILPAGALKKENNTKLTPSLNIM
jgi:integrase